MKKKKQKQLVRVRERILSNGDTKYYLDINQKGRVRITETLDFVYLKNPKSPEERKQNEIVLDAVQLIRNKREQELLSKKYNVTINLKLDTKLHDYVHYMTESKKASLGNYGNWDGMSKHLKRFCPENIEMGSITKEWVKRFKDYLQKELLMNKAMPSDKDMEKLMRYQTTIERQFSKALSDLIVLIDRRKHS